MTVTREADIIGRTYAITATATTIRVETGRHVVVGAEPATVTDAATLALDLDPIAARLLLTAIRATLAEARRKAFPRAWSVAS